MREIATDKAPEAIGPYSQAIDTGTLVFLSGQIPLDPATGQMRSGGIREQAAQVLENIDAVLAGAGLARRNVVKTTVFLASMGDFAALNEVYGEFFGAVRPARSTVQAAALPRGALVEIEAVALRA